MSAAPVFGNKKFLPAFLVAIHERERSLVLSLRKNRRRNGSSVVRSAMSTFLSDYVEVDFCCVVTVVA